MSILHTVNTSPFQTSALKQCLSLFNSGDCLLLIEDAVIATNADHDLFNKLEQLYLDGKLMVLSADLLTRNISHKIGQECTYADFVNLTIEHKSQMMW